MNKDYINFVKSVECPYDLPAEDRVINMMRLWHATSLLCTEAAELQTAIKKHTFYGKELDEVNMLEEAGDLMYGFALLLDTMGWTMEDVLEANKRKLQTRYSSGGFSSEEAINRDTEKEMTAMVQSPDGPIEMTIQGMDKDGNLWEDIIKVETHGFTRIEPIRGCDCGDTDGGCCGE